MNQEQLEKLRAKSKVMALEMAVCGIYRMLSKTPEFGDDVVRHLGIMEMAADRLFIPDTDPAQSDLLASEYKEASEALVKNIRQYINS